MQDPLWWHLLAIERAVVLFKSNVICWGKSASLLPLGRHIPGNLFLPHAPTASSCEEISAATPTYDLAFSRLRRPCALQGECPHRQKAHASLSPAKHGRRLCPPLPIPFSRAQLSELLNRAPQLFSDTRISASFRGVCELDRLPSRYSAARSVLFAANRLESANGIEQFASAETVSLADNAISSVEAAAAPLAAGCPRLRHLSLAGNPLCGLPWWRERVIDMLGAAGITLESLDGAALGPGARAASAAALAHRRAALGGCVAAEIELLQLALLARLVPVHAELRGVCFGGCSGGRRPGQQQQQSRHVRALGSPLPPTYAEPAAPARLLQAAWSGWDMWRDLGDGGVGAGGGGGLADSVAAALQPHASPGGASGLSEGQARLVRLVEARAAAQLRQPQQPLQPPLDYAQRLDAAALRGAVGVGPPAAATSQWRLAFERLLSLQVCARAGTLSDCPIAARAYLPPPLLLPPLQGKVATELRGILLLQTEALNALRLDQQQRLRPPADEAAEPPPPPPLHAIRQQLRLVRGRTGGGARPPPLPRTAAAAPPALLRAAASVSRGVGGGLLEQAHAAADASAAELRAQSSRVSASLVDSVVAVREAARRAGVASVEAAASGSARAAADRGRRSVGRSDSRGSSRGGSRRHGASGDAEAPPPDSQLAASVEEFAAGAVEQLLGGPAPPRCHAPSSISGSWGGGGSKNKPQRPASLSPPPAHPPPLQQQQQARRGPDGAGAYTGATTDPLRLERPLAASRLRRPDSASAMQTAATREATARAAARVVARAKAAAAQEESAARARAWRPQGGLAAFVAQIRGASSPPLTTGAAQVTSPLVFDAIRESEAMLAAAAAARRVGGGSDGGGGGWERRALAMTEPAAAGRLEEPRGVEQVLLHAAAGPTAAALDADGGSGSAAGRASSGSPPRALISSLAAVTALASAGPPTPPRRLPTGLPVPTPRTPMAAAAAAAGPASPRREAPLLPPSLPALAAAAAAAPDAEAAAAEAADAASESFADLDAPTLRSLLQVLLKRLRKAHTVLAAAAASGALPPAADTATAEGGGGSAEERSLRADMAVVRALHAALQAREGGRGGPATPRSPTHSVAASSASPGRSDVAVAMQRQQSVRLLSPSEWSTGSPVATGRGAPQSPVHRAAADASASPGRRSGGGFAVFPGSPRVINSPAAPSPALVLPDSEVAPPLAAVDVQTQTSPPLLLRGLISSLERCAIEPESAPAPRPPPPSSPARVAAAPSEAAAVHVAAAPEPTPGGQPPRNGGGAARADAVAAAAALVQELSGRRRASAALACWLRALVGLFEVRDGNGGAGWWVPCT